MTLTFRAILHDYHVAESNVTGDEYVIRLRPLNDGWMAINTTEDIVLATGIADFSDAKQFCEEYDKLVDEAIDITPIQPDPIAALGDSDEAFENLIASYHAHP